MNRTNHGCDARKGITLNAKNRGMFKGRVIDCKNIVSKLTKGKLNRRGKPAEKISSVGRELTG